MIICHGPGYRRLIYVGFNESRHDPSTDLNVLGPQVDSLGYLSPEGLIEAATRSSQTKHSFCRACFTGVYPVPIEPSKEHDTDW